ncbi:acetamidase/formamidase family protein [Paenibacillus cymbidii]|uniref:acetamidase/formamidase family protein n=1 Tax=Paenibacillus cymbidii TaxID=1639034 RepID=UPI001081DCC0|nr:acetamidase/formamidase family protein [Paenibacillus cymbidii]
MSTHHFAPTVFYNTMGAHEPACRIRSGDTVVTSTIDARGDDKHLRAVGVRPNPMTGPFHVEEAEPGDTLAVRFDRLYPNRDSGWTANVLNHQVLEAELFASMAPRQIVGWDIDLAGGTTRLTDCPPELGGFRLPLAPFLGCFGTAPARREHIATASSAEHGGNMDYRRFTAGSTAYLPVFEPGALFFLGDGHAVQGDGEISGTGVETSFDVTFTVRVIKGRSIGWPRGEDDTWLFAIGNAKPLEMAVKHATSEMVRWLRDDYGLGDVAIGALLGQCVEYEVGNIYNPMYTMVCKLRKSMLAMIAGSEPDARREV